MTDDETEQFPLRYVEDELSRVELPPELAQAVEGFFEVGHEHIVGSGLDDHVVHVGFNIVL
jgi:hypothetical protein